MLVAIVTTVALAASSPCAGATERRDDTRRVHALVCLINEARAEHGLRRLKSDAALGLAARRYAKDMVKRTFFDHTSPGGSTPLSRVRRAGYTGSRVGEALAFAIGSQATPRGTVRGWLHSPPHRRILLDPKMRDLGAGFAKGAPVKIRSAGLGVTVVLDVGAR